MTTCFLVFARRRIEVASSEDRVREEALFHALVAPCPRRPRHQHLPSSSTLLDTCSSVTETKSNPIFLMPSTSSNTVLWVVTHLLAVLNAVFGFMLYVNPDYYWSNETALLLQGVKTTSQDDGHLDPVSVFFFRGDGAFKLAVSFFTLASSKLVVSAGFATFEEATELSAACFLAFLLPAIPVWYLNTDPTQVDIFDASKYKECIVMSSVFCLLLASGLYQSYRQTNISNGGVEPTALTSTLKICRFFMAMGVLFGVQLLSAPEANFAPNGYQPFFSSTSFNDVSFDPVMTYAARMFGVGHMLFAVTFWYLPHMSLLVSVLIIPTVVFFVPLYIKPIFVSDISGVLYRPMWIFILILHTICLAMNCKAVLMIVKQNQSESNKKEA